jgi:hypothetical protein
MSNPNDYTTIIFDIGDVLFTETKTSISTKTLRRMLLSPTWFDYERGKLSEDDCYARIEVEFAFQPEKIQCAFRQARDSLRARGFYAAGERKPILGSINKSW